MYGQRDVFHCSKPHQILFYFLNTPLIKLKEFGRGRCTVFSAVKAVCIAPERPDFQPLPVIYFMTLADSPCELRDSRLLFTE